jgi:hypothetical protein
MQSDDDANSKIRPLLLHLKYVTHVGLYFTSAHNGSTVEPGALLSRGVLNLDNFLGTEITQRLECLRIVPIDSAYSLANKIELTQNLCGSQLRYLTINQTNLQLYWTEPENFFPTTIVALSILNSTTGIKAWLLKACKQVHCLINWKKIALYTHSPEMYIELLDLRGTIVADFEKVNIDLVVYQTPLVKTCEGGLSIHTNCTSCAGDN